MALDSMLMRNRPVAIVIPCVLAVVTAMDRASNTTSPAGDRLRATLAAGMDSLAVALDAVADSGSGPSIGDPPVRVRRARLSFKSVEGLLEYFDGMTATILNGRESEEADADDERESPASDPAHGFAVLDSLLARGDASSFGEVARHAKLMARTVRYSRSLLRHLTFGEAQLFDAVRLELVRIGTLGLGGFDASSPSDRASEAAAALKGLRQAMAVSLATTTVTVRLRRETDARFASAIARLEERSPNELDVFGFIAGNLYPLAHALTAERRARGTVLPRSAGALRPSADFVFDREAFDLTRYAPGHETDTGVALAAIGRKLFANQALSGDGTRSCATCHRPERAFTEPLARTATIDSLGRGSSRNTPTLINAAAQPALFADLRVRSLEDQVATVVASPSEMRGNLDSAAARVGIPKQTIQAALAAYIRTLVATQSRFDRAIRGDSAAITVDERRGFNLFMGKARCGTCHFAPFFNGTAPPDYWSTPPEVIGVPMRPEGGAVDSDLGRGAVDNQVAHRHAFKTPSLRNVGVTGPYMHNGVFRTLDEVIDFYDRGGGAGLGLDVPNQTLRREKIGLTADEHRDLVAFLESLTDTVVARPRR
jgi:cytochrome c peroxidase